MGRFGVKDENTLDHMTWLACSRELERARNESMGIFFLSLQGHKVGYMPLPKMIPKSIYEKTYTSLSAGDKLLTDKWYSLVIWRP